MNEVNATPHAELIAELMNPNNPKNEREHAAVREIERLQEALAQPEQEQEPVAIYRAGQAKGEVYHVEFFKKMDDDEVLFYTTPPQQEQNLNCKSTQARLATAWGYVKAQPEQESFEYWNAVEGWVKIDEVREHFDSVGCGTIYKTAGEGRVPLYTAQRKPLTDKENT